MNYTKVFLMAMVIASSSLFCSCSEKGDEYLSPKFKREIHLDFEILGDELIYAPSNIVATEKYILISGYANAGGDTFYVYDKNGCLIRSGINQGRGPSETLSGYINMSYYDDVVQYNDLQTGERLSFTLSNFLDDSTLNIQKEQMDLPGWCTYAKQTPRGDEVRVISRSATKDLDLPQRAVVLESNSNSYEFTGSAIDDRDISFFSSMQNSVAYSPDGKLMVLSGGIGFILEFFSLEEDIQRIAIKRFLQPSVTITNGMYRQNDDYVFGGGKLCATEKFVYSAYDGKHTAKEWRMSGNSCLLYNNIAVFDWKGNPDVLYTTDYRIMNLSVENDAAVHACLEDGNGRRFIGKARIVR